MTQASIDFTNYVLNKKIDIIGAGISNRPLVKLFYDHGCKEVTVRDAKDLPEDIKAAFTENGARVVCGSDYLQDISGGTTQSES